MYVQQNQQPQQLLAGIPFNIVDQSTFNPNLPNGNDLQIQVQPSQWLQNQQSQQMLGMTVGKFRQKLQEQAARTPLHCWAYNRISQNRFQNQTWNTWVIHLFNFLEFISVAQGQNNPPHVAPDKAADTMRKCYLASCVAEQPQLLQFIQQQPQLVQEIQKYAQLLGAIMQDCNAYRAGAVMTPQHQQQYPQYMQAPQAYSPGQLPPVGSTMQYHQPQQPIPLTNMAVNQHVQAAQLPLQSIASPGGGGDTGMNYGGSSNPAPATPPKVMAPTESYGVTLAPIQPIPVAAAQQPLAVEAEDLDRPIPLTAKDVILDPHYYTPAGVEVDMERPFDTIHSPGGIITRPAYQVPDWKVTRNDSFVYTELVDPTRFIRFYTKWPDGVVQERIEVITDAMKYMVHEIDPDLRAAAHQPKGEVVLTQIKVHKTISDMMPQADIKELQLVDENRPVRMSADFQGTTDMENEVEARRVLRKELGLGNDDPLPAHEYDSTRTHLIEIDDASFEELLGHLDTNDLQQLSKDISLMARQGKLTARVFKFINARLTNEVNSYMHDVLSQDVNIDDFCEDINDLFDFIAKELGERYVKHLKDGTQSILSRAVQIHRTESDDDIVYAINDSFINLQTGWSVSELCDPRVGDEAQLVSQYTHAALIEAIKGMLGRATPAERILRRFRVVTADGAYLEIFRGKLVENAFMFKRVA